jgi:pyruvate/2-oxoglutarate dehydrogenase complex dihydrolipoamide dehydrogenase (E3) component
MPEHDEYDLIVVGGGMAGLPVAIKSAHDELETALVEQELLGGTCLNRGCIPTKTMIRTAEVATLVDRSEEFGVAVEGEPQTDMAAVVDRQQAVVESIRSGTYDNVENTENLDFIEGHGTFESPTAIAVGDRRLRADTIVVNTGARPATPPIDGVDEVETLDSTSALELTEVPDHLAVIGGGYVGCEYAQMYARFGADVTVFQRPDRLLPGEEPDASAVIEDTFEAEDIDVHTETSVEQLEENGSQITISAIGDDESITGDASDVLLAAGRRPNTDRIGLEQTDVETDDAGFIEVDERFQTAEDSIYALGDVTGMPMFTHSARDDADLLYRHLVGDEQVNRTDRHVPHAVFTDPEVGRVGLTEKEAREQGYEVAVGRPTRIRASPRRWVKPMGS